MFAVIYIPDFALQAALRGEPELFEQPVGLVDDTRPKAGLLQLTAAARRNGVCPGMTPTQAIARCGSLVIKSRSIARERAAQDALLQCAYSISPCLEATAEGVCTLALRGLPGAGTEPWLQTIQPRLDRLHLRSQLGVAATPNVAWHAARVGRPFRIVDDPDDFVTGLPVQELDPSPELLEVLRRWGIHTVGAFAALGREALVERLGPEAIELLEQVSPETTRPLQWIQPPEVFEETAEFEVEIELLEPLLFRLRRFLEQISLRLELRGWVAEELCLRLMFSDAPPYERVFRIPAPTRKVDVLFRMLHTHLENLRTPHPVAGLELNAKPIREVRQQFGLFEAALRDPNHFYATVARLTGLLPGDRVGTPGLEDTHRPDAFRLRPVDWGLDAGPSPAVSGTPAEDDTERLGLCLRRLRPPLAATVECREDRPVAFTTALVRGAIRQTQGPWRSSGDWWGPQAWERQEWDVETDEGGLYRLCSREEQWFLEGVYD